MEVANHNQPTPKREILSLTGLRGFAALLIVAYHYTSESVFNHANPVGPAYLGVDLFFILSGFLMALTYAKMFQGGFGWPAYLLFWKRRFARIYPAYIVILLVVFAMALFRSSPKSVPTLISNIFLVQSTGVGAFVPDLGVSIIVPSWSISTEMVAYLVFPILVNIILQRTRSLAVYAALTSILVLLALWAMDLGTRGRLDISDGTSSYGVLRCVAGFSIGMVTYRFWNARFPNEQIPPWVSVATLMVIALCWFCNFDLGVVCALPLLVLMCCDSRSILARVFTSRVALFFGEISYSLYLIHDQVKKARKPVEGLTGLSPYVVLVMLCLLSIGLAYAIYTTIELPARTGLRRFLEGRAPKQAAVYDPAAP